MRKFKRYLPLSISIIVALVLMTVYLVLYRNSQLDISTVIETVLLIIAGVAFWLEFYHKNRVDEAKFIIELNNQFITDPNMTRVEHILEQYYYIEKKKSRKQKSESLKRK